MTSSVSSSVKLLDGLRHTETLVREMLAFSRGGSFSKQAIHVDDAIVTALAGLQPRLRTLGARLDIDVEGARRGRIAGNLDALAGRSAT